VSESLTEASTGGSSENRPEHSPAHHTFSLKWHLLLLLAGALLPVLLFAFAVIHQLVLQEQEASERRVLLAARNLAGAVEREVSGTARTLEALAGSEQLNQGNLSGFDRDLRRAAQTQPTWLSAILLTPDGRQVINTRRPFGTPLSPVNEPLSLRQVVETHQPSVGDLARGRSGQTLAFPVRVPVMQGDELRYVLTAVITPQALAEVVEEQAPVEGEWTRTVVDSQGVVVARTRDPERFVGQRGTPSFLERIGASPEGVYRDTTLEGAKVYVAFSRMNSLPWTAAVTVPVSVIEGPARRAIWWVIGSGWVLLLISGLGALLLSRQISAAIAAAAAAAEHLARGERPEIPPSSITEVASLGSALTYSADLLAQRQQERDQNLAQAEAARAEAEASNRLKDEFLITVSHELKTPLNAILGWIALLRAGQLDSSNAQRAVDVIERNAKAQAHLVEDLLDTSRIIIGKLHLEPHPISLTSIVTNALDSVRHTAATKDVELHAHLQDPGPVMGDPNRLQQVVWNLLSNAIKFTPAGGRVEVNLLQMGSQAAIEVRDTGVGIGPEFLPHVFDRFRQADGSTTRRFGGLGLGLAIVRHLIDLHQGSVEVDSAGEGQGTTFTVKLPLTLTNSRLGQSTIDLDGASHATELIAHQLHSARVIVVDDDPDARDFIAAALTRQGATVKVCGSAAEAFRAVTSWEPTVILSDIGMPEEDGYDLIRKVRSWEGASSAIPAAALTAFTRPEDKAAALAAGFQAHLAKPIDTAELIALVHRLANFQQDSQR
ncbi:MAG TPA: ATP-binding protein, partial [Trichocoleus sp.]